MRNDEAPSGRRLLGQFNSTFCELDYETETKGDTFSGNLDCVNLGPLSISRYKGHGFQRARRHAGHIRSDLVDAFLFALPLGAPLRVQQANQKAIIAPNTGVLVATAKPFEIICDEGQEDQRLVMRLAGPILRNYIPFVDEYCARSIEMRSGAGRVLKSLLESLVEQREGLSDNQTQRCGRAVLNVMAGIMFDESASETVRGNSRETAYADIRLRASNIVKANLSSTSLNAGFVAARCNISVRYLHAAFGDTPTTIGALIRELRLQSSRADLRSYRLRYLSITEIAFRWGFNNSNSFARTYHARFGKAPRDDRSALACQDSPDNHR